MMRHKLPADLIVIERPSGFWVTWPKDRERFVAGPYETLELAMDYIRQKK